MTQNILDIQHLSVVFNTPEGRTSAIRDLSLTIRQGEILAVVGESGCGKSILCRTIMGLLPKQAEIPSGSIRLSGRGEGLELAGISEREYCRIRGADISMVFQDPMTSLDPSCSVGDQIAEAIRLHAEDTARKNDPRAVRAKAVELMDAVGIDRAAQRYDSMPWMLSGGMRQRCVLAMALAREPQMLIADEPTTALDVTVQAEILDLLLHLRDSRNLSILFISHDLGVVSRVADRIAIMYAGRIVEEGTTAEVLHEPAHPYTRGLLRALPAFAQGGRLQPIPGAPPTIPEGFKADAFAERNRYALGIDYVEAPPFFEITPTHRAATWMLDPRAPKIDEAADAGSGSAANAAPDGRSGDGSNDVACDGSSHAAAGSSEDPPANRSGSSGPEAAPAPDPPALLEVRGLSHSFRLGRRSRVDAVKDVSFTIRQGELFALVGESGSGKTTLARCILGMIRPAAGTVLYDGADITDRKQSQRRIAREIQFISQDPGAALDPRMTVRDLIAEPLQLHRICSNRRERNERIVAMLREVQLDERILDRYPAQLSGGQKQRVSIARAFVMDPKLLVADEPLASLDVSIQAQIVELLLTLQKRHSTSVLFISHDLSMVELISDRVGVMCRGSLVEAAPTEELFLAPKHPYTQKLLAAIPAIEPARRETNPK